MNITGIDVGTSKIKIVQRKENKLSYKQICRSEISNFLTNHSFNSKEKVIITGSGASSLPDLPNTIFLNELECTANIFKYLNLAEGLVINIGTGTAFVSYSNNSFQHITGTGIGGGTFNGLCQRILKTKDHEKIQKMAAVGIARNINIVVNDIYSEQLSWLSGDTTVSNFAKNGQNIEDIAIAIHSLVIEPIISILKAIVTYQKPQNIVFSGGVMNNPVIKKQLDSYCKDVEIEYYLLDKPSYGTILGAIALFESIER